VWIYFYFSSFAWRIWKEINMNCEKCKNESTDDDFGFDCIRNDTIEVNAPTDFRQSDYNDSEWKCKKCGFEFWVCD
jgi:hypothetical protein